MAMTVVNAAYMTFYSEPVCICSTLGRGAHGNDGGTRSPFDRIFYEFESAPRPSATHMAMTMANGAYMG
eukprot:8788034-Karenia_brevis.AAC.1